MSSITFLVVVGVWLTFSVADSANPEVNAKFWGQTKTASSSSGSGGAASSTTGRGSAAGHGLQGGATSTSYYGGTGSSTSGTGSAYGSNEFGQGSTATSVHGGAGSGTSGKGSATGKVNSGYGNGGAGGYLRGLKDGSFAGGLGGGALAGGFGGGYLGVVGDEYLGGGVTGDVGGSYPGGSVGSGYLGGGVGYFEGGLGSGFLGGGVGGVYQEEAAYGGIAGGQGISGYGNGAVNELGVDVPYVRGSVYPDPAHVPIAAGGFGSYDNYQFADDFVPRGAYGGLYVGDVGRVGRRTCLCSC